MPTDKWRNVGIRKSPSGNNHSVIGPGKNYQWILKLEGEKPQENPTYLYGVNVYPQNTLNYKQNSNFTVEKACRHHRNKVIKVTITSNGTKLPHEHPDMMHWERYNVTYEVLMAKMCNLNQTFRKFQKKLNLMDIL